MLPIRTQWTRLIRFVAAETAQVHIGEPVDSKLDVGLAFHQKKPIKAYEIIGSALDPKSQVTKNVLTVKELLAPLSREEVGLVRCLGLNYADHAAEANLAKPTYPVLFYKPVNSLIGPDVPVTVPKHVQPVEKHLPDYEVELTVVIGKAAKNVSEADALDYVLAYTAGNDISFRYHQMAVSQWNFSKGYDNTTPIGPCLVAAHTIPDPQNVPLKTTVNGKVLQDGTTADQIFNVRQTIAFLSQGTTLLPGSIIMTGTPKGVGFVKKPPQFLKDGDDMSVWIGNGIGTLVNPVVEERGNEKAKL
ncbi:fumarylacetoacetate hydrolase [Lentinus tigrinus ALCF2SS1-7]|uniref:Fumarylacetoacetate hydrolase n=1 Tax=Lentinus tigrinus ALCF2SS1-6 TaxID=1328759 RepID=A0A5C2SUF2_9APHY|nr:fumarylacetoacetate hydrolase [Lentinus tigrinus ALCF2SS1-6]RPD81452.1 fumarylacetoacetate hydrolase [Lentinus tigrinus ALCF2SS1-7]